MCVWRSLCCWKYQFLCVCSKSFFFISAEGFKASNALSWLGTSDIFITSLPLWTEDALGCQEKKDNNSYVTSSFCMSCDTSLKNLLLLYFAKPCMNTWNTLSFHSAGFMPNILWKWLILLMLVHWSQKSSISINTGTREEPLCLCPIMKRINHEHLNFNNESTINI